MAQASRPAADHVATFPDSDAGPYSADQWAELLALTHIGDPDTSSERAQLRGVVPTAWNHLVVTNPAGVTIRAASGAAWVNGHIFVHDPTVVPAAPLDFTPSTPGANRIDRVVVVVNNTNAAYSTNLEFPTVLTDYAGLASIPAYSCRLAILTGVAGGAMRALVQTSNYWMIEIARYTISAVPAISGLTDYRYYAQIEHIIGATDTDGMADALIIGTELDSGTALAGLGTCIRAQLEDAGGTRQDAGRQAWRWHTPTAGAEVSQIEFRTEYITNEVLSGVVVAPQNASVDGNARGVGAVDFQGYRNAATQVASGATAVVSGGQRNTASGISATVPGGSQNTASGDGAIVGGGTSNTASQANTVIGGGSGNTSSGSAATVGGGTSNTASATQASVLGGLSNTASGNQSSIVGGSANVASAQYSSVPGGSVASADKYGQFAHAAGAFAATGDAQGTVQMVARGTQTHGDNTWRSLYLDGAGASERMTIAASTAWTVDCLVVGITQNAAAQWSYQIFGLIERDNANNTTMAASTTTTIFESDANFDAQLVADDANEALVVQVQDTGSSGATVRWVATVRMAEVTYP